MFQNPGHKIQGVAMALFVLEVLASISTGLLIVANNSHDAIWALLIIIIGITISWIFSLLLYGFGELIIRNAQTARNTALLARHFNEKRQQPAPKVHESNNDKKTDEAVEI